MAKDGRKIIEVSAWIVKSLLGELTAEEQRQLEAWVAESGQHSQLFTEICNEQRKHRFTEQQSKEQLELAFQRFVRERNKRERIARRFFWRKYAALFILPLIVCGGLWWIYPEKGQQAEKVAEVSAFPMNDKPILILEDGKEIVVDGNNSMLAHIQGGQSFSMDSAELVYSGNRTKGVPLQYHTLTTPAKCDYQLILADGTRVWLNAASSLRYPVVFGPEERTVYASGEIYLQVAKDAGRPFYVVTNALKVEVSGTSFNVNAYENEGFTTVTLVEGKVVAHTDTESVQLLPNQQLTLDHRNNQLHRKQVDAREVVAWKEGLYIFKGQTLGEVAKVLERWYVIEIVFAQPTDKEIVYTGVIQKEDPLEKFIRTLKKTSQFDCRLEGVKLYIN